MFLKSCVLLKSSVDISSGAGWEPSGAATKLIFVSEGMCAFTDRSRVGAVRFAPEGCAFSVGSRVGAEQELLQKLIGMCAFTDRSRVGAVCVPPEGCAFSAGSRVGGVGGCKKMCAPCKAMCAFTDGSRAGLAWQILWASWKAN